MNKYIEIIKETNPGLIIEKYSFNKEGQNNDVVIINDNLIFKFPKYFEGIEKLKREADILNMLKIYITLDIPNCEYKNFNDISGGKSPTSISGGHILQQKENFSGSLNLLLKSLITAPQEMI